MKQLALRLSPLRVQNNITERFYEIADHQKLDVLINILSNFKPENVIIFTNTKIEAKAIAKIFISEKLILLPFMVI